MLQSLYVDQFVIIEKLDLNFKDRLTIFTGETGAGKSIILGAMALILGGPSTPKSIRHGHKKSTFKATFAPPKNKSCLGLINSKAIGIIFKYRIFDLSRNVTRWKRCLSNQ